VKSFAGFVIAWDSKFASFTIWNEWFYMEKGLMSQSDTTHTIDSDTNTNPPMREPITNPT